MPGHGDGRCVTPWLCTKWWGASSLPAHAHRLKTGYNALLAPLGETHAGPGSALGKARAVMGWYLSCVVDLLQWTVLWTLFWQAWYRAETREEAVHFVTTSDGWRLALSRYPRHGVPRTRCPVLLCHGLGANRFTFDLGRPPSLAVSLAHAVSMCGASNCGGMGGATAPGSGPATVLGGRLTTTYAATSRLPLRKCWTRRGCPSSTWSGTVWAACSRFTTV
jgi:hypothetical protein